MVKRRIGLMTFFKGENYGALLQAYSLQTAVRCLGHDAEIINFYRPGIPIFSIRSYLGRGVGKTWNKIRTILHLLRVRPKFQRFHKYFCIGPIHYRTFEDLHRNPPDYDIYICGSDQVWNCTGGIEDTAYFLDFGGDNIRRVAYAPSFGATTIPDACRDEVRRCLRRFSVLSARESSGCRLLEDLGFPYAPCMPDPTLLLDKADFEALAVSRLTEKNKIFSYILHESQGLALDIVTWIADNIDSNILNVSLQGNRISKGVNRVLTLTEWIYSVKNAELIVTNSFHAVIFSLIFHKPFLVVRLQGNASAMNDRLISILDRVKLQERLIGDFDVCVLKALIGKKIIWTEIDNILNEWKAEGNDFLRKALGSQELL